MKDQNFKIYGIILLAIAGFMIFRTYYYFYWEWMYEYSSIFNWAIIIACGVIGLRIMGHICGPK
jgi:hypothetical protein